MTALERRQVAEPGNASSIHAARSSFRFHLPGQAAALQRGGAAGDLRPGATREEFACIRADLQVFIAIVRALQEPGTTGVRWAYHEV